MIPTKSKHNRNEANVSWHGVDNSQATRATIKRATVTTRRFLKRINKEAGERERKKKKLTVSLVLPIGDSGNEVHIGSADELGLVPKLVPVEHDEE
jgi:hypothetical protein